MSAISRDILDEARDMLDTEHPLSEATDGLFNAMYEELYRIADELEIDRQDLIDELFDEYNDMFVITTS
jgi:hypothetical protein